MVKKGEMTLGIRGEDLKMDAQNLELYKENKNESCDHRYRSHGK